MQARRRPATLTHRNATRRDPCRRSCAAAANQRGQCSRSAVRPIIFGDAMVRTTGTRLSVSEERFREPEARAATFVVTAVVERCRQAVVWLREALVLSLSLSLFLPESALSLHRQHRQHHCCRRRRLSGHCALTLWRGLLPLSPSVWLPAALSPSRPPTRLVYGAALQSTATQRNATRASSPARPHHRTTTPTTTRQPACPPTRQTTTKMTFEFLSPLLTPVALATVEKNPRVIVILIVVLVGLLALVGLAYLIHWRTEKNNGTWPGPVPVVSRVLKERRKRRDKMREE
ncbi:uncharacterized protein J3D65DRAFT_679437 [Phyllosticta citribraziliensis]|uniref:Uncharacterized protein n=1 Tax=Phyllosticta citribraziliensis TaxID=989973 RepID=A0ABR1LE35_9PEZI